MNDVIIDLEARLDRESSDVELVPHTETAADWMLVHCEVDVWQWTSPGYERRLVVDEDKAARILRDASAAGLTIQVGTPPNARA